jgi:hypothetical protein
MVIVPLILVLSFLFASSSKEGSDFLTLELINSFFGMFEVFIESDVCKVFYCDNQFYN